MLKVAVIVQKTGEVRQVKAKERKGEDFADGILVRQVDFAHGSAKSAL